MSQLWTSFARQMGPQSMWQFLDEQAVIALRGEFNNTEVIGTLDPELVLGHYQHCNEFLWFVMHDLSGYANYSPQNHKKYNQFNAQLSQLFRSTMQHNHDVNFIQDYQIALLPALLSDQPSYVFWHTPWPKAIEENFVPVIAEIVHSVLKGNLIGFHIPSYVDNFLQFVEQHLPEYRVNRESNTVTDSSKTHLTQVISTPLGIDIAYWNQLLSASLIQENLLPANITSLFDATVVLSVDRADITKGILERFQMIDRFFALHKEQIGKINFLQIISKTRAGISLFERYWNYCHKFAQEINSRWGKEGWKPICWIEEPLPPAQLSVLYRKASCMLVNPLVDGLNITAKEYVTCQSIDQPGVLLLSPGAGVWAEIGGCAILVIPQDTDQMCQALIKALTMSSDEKASRLKLMKKKIEAWTFADWWGCFSQWKNGDHQPYKLEESLQSICCGVESPQYEHKFVVNTAITG